MTNFVFVYVCDSIDLHQNLLLNNLDSVAISNQLALPPPPSGISLTSPHQTTAPADSIDPTTTSVMTPRMTPVASLPPMAVGAQPTALQPLTLTQFQSSPHALSHHQAAAAGFSYIPTSFSQTASPYQIQFGGQQMVQPFISVLAYDGSTGTNTAASFIDPRTNLATKIKGGYVLASIAKTANKYSPY